MSESLYSPVPFAEVRVDRPVLARAARDRADAHHSEPARQARRGRHPRFAEAAEAGSAADHSAQRARLHHAGLLGLRRRQMDRGGELRAVAPARSPTSRRRSTRSSTISPGRSRPTAISTAGTTAASPTSAGRTCATTTSSTTPAICSKARSPIFARRAGDGSSTSWSVTSITSPRRSEPGPGQKRGYPGHQEIELALVKLYRLTGDRRRLDLAAYFIDERGRRAALFHRGGAGARRRSGAPIGRRPTNTISRTFPCASRRKWSGTPCARCTWPRRWPTSPSNSTTTS